jgi:hypothetical protein
MSLFSPDHFPNRWQALGWIFVMSVVLVSCRPKKDWPVSGPEIQAVQADYQAALNNATNSISYAAEFVQLFPNAESGFSYYIGGAGTTAFYMDADLYGRYELKLFLPSIKFDASRRKVTGFGDPEFIIQEVAELKQISKVGSLGAVTNWSVSYSTQGSRRFGGAEWKKVVAARGDFSVIGFNFITNSPVPKFREYRDRQKNQ